TLHRLAAALALTGAEQEALLAAAPARIRTTRASRRLGLAPGPAQAGSAADAAHRPGRRIGHYLPASGGGEGAPPDAHWAGRSGQDAPRPGGRYPSCRPLS